MNHRTAWTSRSTPSASDSSHDDVLDPVAHVTALLAHARIDDALRFLNGRTRFRFTGIFEVDPPALRNIRLIDRENPGVNVSGAVATVDVGYCGIACSTGAPFVTANAGKDSRLRTHPARSSMMSYAGVPLRLASGVVWGTLCHYDVRPRLLPPSELSLLEAAAPRVAGWVAQHCGGASSPGLD